MKTNTPKFHELAISDVVKETPESVVITFDLPSALREHYAFIPGQYVTLRATIDGQDIRRSYSICSAPGLSTLSIGIKSIPSGVFSNFAQHLSTGDRMSVMTPQGRFTAPLGGKHSYLLLAAGSGITPMVSIAQSVLSHEPDSTVTLFYANRTTRSVMFRKHLEDLKDRYMSRFLLTHVMDEELQDVGLFNGRLDAEKLHSLETSGLITLGNFDATYVCGPAPMIENVCAALEDAGVQPSTIKKELFTPSTPLRTASETPASNLATVDKQHVTAQVRAQIDGSSRTFSVMGTQTVLEAATSAGFELPYSCANGMCATCRCKLKYGSASMSQNFSLEPWEIDEGFVLACQLRPTSPSIELDFDAV